MEENKIKGRLVLPFIMTYFEQSLLVRSVIKDTKAATLLQKGDRIIAINGSSIPKIRDSLKAFESYACESFLEIRLEAALYNNQRKSENQYRIVRNHKDTISITVPNISSEEWHSKVDVIADSPKAFELLNDSTGILRIGIMKDSDIDVAMKALKGTQNMIVDLTQYPEIDNNERLLSYFTNQKTIPYISIKAMSEKSIGLFVEQKYSYSMPKVPYKFKGQLIVFISDGTISAGETLATLFKNSTNAVFIGQQTACTNGTAVSFYLPGNVYVRFTGVWVGYPNTNECYQKKGIKPDILVIPTEQDVLNGGGSRQKRGLEYIKNKI